MYFSNYLSQYVNIITVLLFAIPLFWQCVKRKTFKPLTFEKLIGVFNWTIIYYAVICIVLLAIMKIIDVTVYGRAGGSNGNNLAEIAMGVGYTYVFIGAFFYLPTVGLLNCINLALRKLTKRKRLSQ